MNSFTLNYLFDFWFYSNENDWNWMIWNLNFFLSFLAIFFVEFIQYFFFDDFVIYCSLDWTRTVDELIHAELSLWLDFIQMKMIEIELFEIWIFFFHFWRFFLLNLFNFFGIYCSLVLTLFDIWIDLC